jgi:hypothetical protein
MGIQFSKKKKKNRGMKKTKFTCRMITHFCKAGNSNVMNTAKTPSLYLYHLSCETDEVYWLTNLLHGAESFLRRQELLSYSKDIPPVMEPESSLPCSQQPATGPYPEPDESNPQRTNVFP